MKTNRKTGFTLVEIMIVVSIIGLLAAIAIPSFARARRTSQMNACINNLRQLDAAKAQWAIENNKVDSDGLVSADLEPYLKKGIISGLMCPAGGGYVVTTVGADPICGLGGGHTI
ncbi:MAG: type II secretion system protein [Verrucomicrobiota bacterium]